MSNITYISYTTCEKKKPGQSIIMGVWKCLYIYKLYIYMREREREREREVNDVFSITVLVLNTISIILIQALH